MAAAAAEATLPTVKKLLKSGKFETPTITVNGPATVRQELWLPAPNGGHTIRAAGGKGGKAAKKTKRDKKAAGPVLAGKAFKVATRKGEVKLTIKLTGAARKVLNAAKRDVRFTVKTSTKAQGSKVTKKKVTALVVPLR